MGDGSHVAFAASTLGSATVGRTLKRQGTYKRLTTSKTVGIIGGLSLLINSLSGPGLVYVPQLFQQAGWLPALLCFGLFFLMGTIGSLFLVESMQNIPGNRHFQGTVEFATLINFYFENKYLHYLGQFMLYAALQGLNVANIVLTIQQFDKLVMAIFKKDCGIAFSSNVVSVAPTFNSTSPFFCVAQTALDGVTPAPPSPFGNVPMFITLGMVIALCTVFPLGTLNLDDNIWSQIAAVVIAVVIVFQWLIAFFMNGLSNPLPAFGSSIPSAPGLTMTNYAFIVTVPSWINVKQKHVPVSTTLWSATAGATIVYILVGIFGALSLKDVQNLLSALGEIDGTLGTVSNVFGYIFTIAVLMASIPVTCIVARNNLVQNEILSYRIATVFTHVLPWLASIPMQTGSAINTWTNWTGLLFISTANFIIPFLIYLRATSFRDGYENGRALTKHQRNILRSIHESSESIHRYIDRLDRRSKGKSDQPRLQKFFTDVNFEKVLNDGKKVDYGDGWDPDAENGAQNGGSAPEPQSRADSDSTRVNGSSKIAEPLLSGAATGSSRDGYAILAENLTESLANPSESSRFSNSLSRIMDSKPPSLNRGTKTRWRRDILEDVRQPGAGLVPRSVTRRWGASSQQSDTMLEAFENASPVTPTSRVRPTFLRPLTLPVDDPQEESDDDGDLTWSSYGDKEAKEDIADIAKGYMAITSSPAPSERPRGLLDRSAKRSRSLDSVRLSNEDRQSNDGGDGGRSSEDFLVKGESTKDAETASSRKVRFGGPEQESEGTSFLPPGIATQAEGAEDIDESHQQRNPHSDSASSAALLLPPKDKDESESEDEGPDYSLKRSKTIPTNPNFVSPAFQAVPNWWKVTPRTVARAFLGFLSVLIVATTVYSFVLLGLGQNPFGG
ncbi:hypothetical protein M427DRAFT_221514 [Gonapodya prolifera JEL478]|uniref:Amino acid transporter transmembrane domain-containing protein n=1 Tax=Gonapodya prolifera (strain JEL478) TaxID=1344416 RepID=A0A139AN65_GONPJ|nr:hypothetical protein M427DRAFT_221514 [Gonapodya prolifera JEL478]|eukprot:KXS18074.1 hypothetical protein M427DRAFT_221514 [Gonapodya prolifera JEL478]